jgi:hypothetical protein
LAAVCFLFYVRMNFVNVNTDQCRVV